MPWFEFLSSAHVQHLAMTLIHNLWQGAIIALALVGLLRLIPARKASLRYAACLAAMTLVLVCGLATWGWLNVRAGNATASAAASESLTAPPSTAVFSIWNWQLMLVTVWLVGVLFMLCRLARSFCQVQHLKQKSRDASADVQSLVAKIANRCGLHKPLRVLVSDTISSAAVIGIFKPVLFIPASMITGLNQSQLEAVIAHEVAHIRRLDPVVNFCQSLIEAFLFFNPAVVWIGGQVRMEREACCDMFGVTATGDKSTYLDTLAFWAEKMKNQDSPSVAGALAFADRQESTLLDRVRRVVFPDFIPATRFSPISTVFLFAIGLTLLASLWQGTMLAVAVADELLPHEQIVAELTETRDEYEGKPAPLNTPIKTTGPMTVKIKVETEDGEPTTSVIWTNYDTYVMKENTKHRHNRTGNSISPGDTECSFVVREGWANILVTGDDYVPVTFRNVRPDKNGVANLVVPLRSGYPGEMKVVGESGEPVADATIHLTKVLQYKVEEKTSASSKSTYTGGTGVGAGQLTTNADGVAVIEHAADQPVFQVRVTAPGYEQVSGAPFGIKEGHAHKIVMQRALPVVGRITDDEGNPLANVKLHVLSSVKKTHAGSTGRSSGAYYCKKRFNEIIATTSETGEFMIDSLESGWAYNLVADAGDRGVATCFGVRPGDEKVAIEIAGPINLSGTVTGELERLKQEDKYVLPYAICIKSPRGSRSCDSTGRVDVSVVDGKGTFRLENVIPGEFNFHATGRVPIFESSDDLEIVIPSTESPGADAATIVRRARLQFKSLGDGATFRGRVTITSRKKNGEVYFDRLIEVVDGVAEFAVNAPTKLFVELMDAPGFVFEKGLRGKPS